MVGHVPARAPRVPTCWGRGHHYPSPAARWGGGGGLRFVQPWPLIGGGAWEGTRAPGPTTVIRIKALPAPSRLQHLPPPSCPVRLATGTAPAYPQNEDRLGSGAPALGVGVGVGSGRGWQTPLATSLASLLFEKFAGTSPALSWRRDSMETGGNIPGERRTVLVGGGGWGAGGH